MIVAVCGTLERARALADELGGSGAATAWAPGDDALGDDGGSTAPLAHALLALEAELSAIAPERVVCGDDSDAALAAALVAAKLELGVDATPAAREDRSANGRLIAQLAAP